MEFGWIQVRFTGVEVRGFFVFVVEVEMMLMDKQKKQRELKMTSNEDESQGLHLFKTKMIT